MFKIVHLFAGVSALLLSVIATSGEQPAALLQQPDAVYLVIFALFNLLTAAWAGTASANLAGKAVSVLVVLATALQALVVLTPLPLVASQPAILLALATLAAAVLVQLTGYLPARRPSSAHPAAQGNRETGTVKWFNTSKGFGFISRDSGDDIFVHFRAIRGEGHRVLLEGQRVEFAVMLRDKGLQAEDVITIPTAKR